MTFGVTRRQGGSPTILFLAVAGVVLSIGMFFHLRDASREADRALLERQAAQFQQTLKERVDRQMLLLHALRGLFAGRTMTRTDFVAAVSPMRPLFPELGAVGWARHVAARDIPALEREVCAEGLADFTVRGGGVKPLEGQAGDHFIVSYLDQVEPGVVELGLDLATLP